MQYKSRSSYVRWAMVLIGIAVLVLVTVFGISLAARTDYGPTQQQDIIRLDQRVTQMEQRLYSIESSLRNIEQQSRLAGVTSRGIRPEDLVQLQSEFQALQRRLAEHECALAKLDERTLTAAARAARRKSGPTEPCRLNADIPLQLSGVR